MLALRLSYIPFSTENNAVTNRQWRSLNEISSYGQTDCIRVQHTLSERSNKIEIITESI